jgi:alcohol dehydrogenase class IV
VLANLALPRILRIGAGASCELGPVLVSCGWSRVLIVTDTYLTGSGAVARLIEGLETLGVACEVFDATVPDPTTDSLEPLVAVLRDGAFDCVVGFGGGSPLDTAKAAAFLATRGGVMRDYKAPRANDEPSLPVIAIPTTAGSGSECTKFAIVTDSATQEKMLCSGLAFLPTVALVDYELTMSMPVRLTADTGVDALTHAIEAYVSRRANPFTDSLAISAMKSISSHLRAAVSLPDDRVAREAMMLAATQAGMAFSNASVALVHGMSRPIGAHFHVAHGLSNAMLLPVITGFSLAGAPERYADCARATGAATVADSVESAGAKLVQSLQQLNDDLAVPTPQSYGIDSTRWDELLPLMAEQAIGSGSPANNPRIPTHAQIVELYQEAWSR